MIFLGNKRILEEVEKISLYFKERLDNQDERINELNRETNSNYRMSYINDKQITELNDKFYKLNEDLKFIIHTDIVIIILLTIFIGINVYLMIK